MKRVPNPHCPQDAEAVLILASRDQGFGHSEAMDSPVSDIVRVLLEEGLIEKVSTTQEGEYRVEIYTLTDRGWQVYEDAYQDELAEARLEAAAGAKYNPWQAAAMANPTSLIDTDEDIQWLRDVHIPDLPKNVKSAMIFGNEDYPDKISTFVEREPTIHSQGTIYRPDEDGNYIKRRVLGVGLTDEERQTNPTLNPNTNKLKARLLR